MLCKSCVSRSG
uniref:Uncharacterized protein n=1 Tax=Anguilla anguilla TaxID=7936 RepID=A0A0E9SEH7_ANGAN